MWRGVRRPQKHNWPGQEDLGGRYLWGVKALVPLCEFASRIKSKASQMPPLCDEVQMCLYDEITWSRLMVLFTQTEK